MKPFCRRASLAAGLSLLVFALGLQGCASPGSPTVIALGETELGLLVDRAFPVQKRVLDVLDVQLTGPKLRLQPESNRLAVAVAVQSQDRVLGRTAKGYLAFETGLRYEPRDASIRLVRVRVVSLGLDGTAPTPASVAASAPAPTGAMQRLGAALAERGLEDLPIYHVTAERQASLKQLGLVPTAVTVTARGVEITLSRPSSQGG